MLAAGFAVNSSGDLRIVLVQWAVHRRVSHGCELFRFLNRFVNVGPMKFHVPLRRLHRCEAKLRVEAVRITSQQGPAAQALQLRMLHDALHEPLTQSATTMRLEHEYVPQVRVGGAIADHTGEANLRVFSIINAKAERMLDGSPRD